MKFLKKRKANKIAKLKTRVIELEEENDDLKRKVFLYKLKNGEIKEPRRAGIKKLMGNAGSKRGPRPW